MTLFLFLAQKLIPLYILVGFGFVAGKILKVQREHIAKLLIYLIAPAVILTGMTQTKIPAAYLLVPIACTIVCCLMCAFFLKVGGLYWKGPTKNLLAFGAGDANTGYFGLPVAIQLFGDQIIGYAILFFVGFLVYENTLGFYIAARGNYTAKESLQSVLRLPTIYAFIGGILLGRFGFQFDGVYADLAAHLRGTYTVLGMMMIGMGVSTITKFRVDWKLVALAFTAKFVCWPVVVFSIIYLDTEFFHVFSKQMQQLMILISAVPMAANTVAIATELKVEPEKASVAVLLSTIFALFFIPFMVTLFMS